MNAETALSVNVHQNGCLWEFWIIIGLDIGEVWVFGNKKLVYWEGAMPISKKNRRVRFQPLWRLKTTVVPAWFKSGYSQLIPLNSFGLCRFFRIEIQKFLYEPWGVSKQADSNCAGMTAAELWSECCCMQYISGQGSTFSDLLRIAKVTPPITLNSSWPGQWCENRIFMPVWCWIWPLTCDQSRNTPFTVLPSCASARFCEESSCFLYRKKQWETHNIKHWLKWSLPVYLRLVLIWAPFSSVLICSIIHCGSCAYLSPVIYNHINCLLFRDSCQTCSAEHE